MDGAIRWGAERCTNLPGASAIGLIAELSTPVSVPRRFRNPWHTPPRDAQHANMGGNKRTITAHSLDGLAVLAADPLVVDEESERDLDLALESGVVELVSEGRCHSV